ncbi:DUF507 family protein [Hydrogenimonas cancrithermarum]|uniref:Competence/damage-inducible domain protein n=1 Tax=Hydrogenimonas cancrithermarum TaxID=2993563 RepID=A0ABN6WV35_9BACT|nr:DUF507 family protein [Hydrogenimonas cancrithermarum]BDY12817.1 hypothetical protein HCR_11290 [Hydrogenimonas cancrithermarum]BDY12934.1 hypothetical protein HCR_12460 [Hydrogenimonas cancrithermarum]
MKLNLAHAPYIANKIGIDLANAPFVEIKRGLEPVIEKAKEVIEADIKNERALEERVNELLEEKEDEIEFMRADVRQLFWMIKKKLAPEYGVILNNEERYSDLSHKILNELWEEDLIDYTVSENQVRGVIFKAIEDYMKSFEQIEDAVLEKMSHYKRELHPGTEEYDLIFERLYEEELRKRGMM